MFEDRKKGLEKKVDIDAQKKFKIAAIKNKKIAQWAAEKQNLDASKVDAYIDEVIISDFDEPRHEDVIRKIFNDFKKANINISYDEIKDKLSDFEKEAMNKLSE